MFRGKPSGKGQIPARHKPKMLAGDLRSRAPKKPVIKAKSVPQDVNQLEPFINIDLSKVSWPVLLFLLILVPAAVGDTNILRVLIEGISVNGRSVELLPADARCKPNPVGKSQGEICKFDSATHYVKLFKPQKAEHVKADGLHISYEEYNRQFVKYNIGIDVVDASYYVKSPQDKSIYQAGKGIDGLMFTQHKKATNKQLGEAGVAKWAVATTFIFDLHSRNVGYTDKGLVMLDLDGYEQLPAKTLGGNVILAAVGMYGYAPELSLRDLDQMIAIYREMQKKPLPAHHNEFHMTEKMYQGLLKTYIELCQQTKTFIEQNWPDFSYTERTNFINQSWCDFVKARMPENQHGAKIYQDLCVHRNVG